MRSLAAASSTDPAIFERERVGLLSTIWRFGGVDDEVIRRLAARGRATVIEADIRLAESVRNKGLKGCGYGPGPLVLAPSCGRNCEHSIRTRSQWMREAVDGRRDGAAPGGAASLRR